MKPTRVLIVDDHEVVRLGLTSLIQDQADFEVVGEAGTSSQALDAVEQLEPDIVLMDLRIPGVGGIEATQQITSRHTDVKVIILTSFADDDLIWRAVMAGASGYVLKQVGNAELLRALDAVRHGEALLDPAVTQRMLKRVRALEKSSEDNAVRGLSDRELQVLSAVASGKTNLEIAQVLAVSEKSVRNYVSKLLDKLHVRTRVELATFAIQHHVTDPLNKNEGQV